MRGKRAGAAVLVAVLGAGCASDDRGGVTAPTNAPTTAVPVARGWLDDHSTWGGGSGPSGPMADGAAFEAAASDTVGAKGGARLPEPAVAATNVGPPVEVGLRAGAVDDNEQWDDYLRYATSFEALGIPFRTYDVGGRRIVTARDRDGRPVLDALVEVVGAGGKVASEARTGADGRAIVFVPAAGPSNGQQQAAFSVTVTKGDVADTSPTDVLAPEVRLDMPEATGSTTLDVQFLIDATGSMGDEIERLKANMISVAERIAALPAKPQARFAMTVYRDRGDLFVTRSFDFTGDVAAFTAALGEVVAADGGDTPEDVESGLAAALAEPAWSTDDAVRLVFVVADAAPHLDYDGSTPYTASIDAARAKGVRITPIASSGLDDQGEYVFRQLAQATLGQFVFLTYGADGATPGDTTTHHVDGYAALALDDLVVQLVSDELASRG